MRNADPARWDAAIDLIKAADTIAISGHTHPDGDALGSVLGLGLALRRHFPLKRVSFLLADDAKVPRVYRFLPQSTEMAPAAAYDGDPDLLITVDAPTPERLADTAALIGRARTVLTIDHHPARAEFADVAVRDPGAAATAVLIDGLLAAADISLAPDVADCLFCGLVTDTGRFQYQNADPAAFACAARLVAAGADPARIALEVYQSQRLGYLHLEARVMGRIATVADGRVAYSFARNSDLAECGVGHDECDGLIDAVRQLDGAEVCLFLREAKAPGLVRGNLRSKTDADVSSVAARFGGGGHPAASGLNFEGTVEEALAAILPELAALVGAPGRAEGA